MDEDIKLNLIWLIYYIADDNLGRKSGHTLYYMNSLEDFCNMVSKATLQICKENPDLEYDDIIIMEMRMLLPTF